MNQARAAQYFSNQFQFLNVNIITTFIYYNERVFILQFSGSLAAALLIMQNLSALGLAAFTVQVLLPLATP